jgi:hypothetical protein
MENPATWGPLEHVVDAALDRAEKDRAAGLVGLSRTRVITDAVRQWLAGHGDTQQVRADVAEALWTAFREDSGFVEAVMAVVAPRLAAAVEREQNLHQVVTEWHDRAQRAEAEVQRLGAARLVLAVFGVPEDAPQPFSLCRDKEVVGLGVQWPGGAVTIKWTPPDRLATVTSHSLEDALAVADFPDGTLGVVWLSEDLGTLAEAQDRILAVEKLIEHREQRYADRGGTTIKAIPVADLRRAIGMEET